jgi:hypothetical protein
MAPPWLSPGEKGGSPLPNLEMALAPGHLEISGLPGETGGAPLPNLEMAPGYLEAPAPSLAPPVGRDPRGRPGAPGAEAPPAAPPSPGDTASRTGLDPRGRPWAPGAEAPAPPAAPPSPGDMASFFGSYVEKFPKRVFRWVICCFSLDSRLCPRQ